MLYYVDAQGNKSRTKNKKTVGQYYFLDDIEKANCDLNIVLSARNLGKSVQLGQRIFDDYFKKGYTSAFVRRYKDQFNAPNMRGIFNDAVNLGYLDMPENQMWENVEYRAGAWYFTRYDEELDKVIRSPEPFCVGIGLNMSNQNARGMSQPKLHRMYLDEMIAKGYGDDTYLPGEYMTFMNLISTLARMKDDFKVYMFGNTQGQPDDCPYFEEWGIDMLSIEKGKITKIRNHSDVWEGYMAIERVEARDKAFAAPQNKFFSFGKNDKAEQMIVNGDWETREFPHLPFEYEINEVKREYYIYWRRYILRCEIIKHDGCVITYISSVYEGENIDEANEIINKLDKAIIFSPYATGQRRWYKYLTKPANDIVALFYSFFKNGQVYYETNTVGETVSAYLRYSMNASIIEAN